VSAPTIPKPAARGLGTPGALLLVFAVTLAFRLLALPGSTPANMDPDAAHFLNVARCFERGQGFSNVGAWPAWMKPERLPMPETFKEPGFPWLIWKLKPLTGGDPFRAGQLISMIGGLAIPLLLYGLARMVSADRGIALVAGLLAAGSPLLIAQSARVMVDSIFPAAGIAAMTLAAWRSTGAGRGRAIALDVLTGVALGAAFLLRGGALMLLLPLAILAFRNRRPAAALGGCATILLAAAAVASPFIARNLRLFHTWFHSDVGAYGIWPYVDPLTFNAGLERPPAPIAFALHHLPEVARHWVGSAAIFTLHTFPEEILGPAWPLPVALGLLLALRRWREHLFAFAFLLVVTAFIFAVHWDARYFVTAAGLGCLFAATGAMAIARAIGGQRLIGRLEARWVLLVFFAFTLLAQAQMARQMVRRFESPENPAAVALAPELHRRLLPGESAMVMTTSTYAWFADRPTVHLVISDRARFDATLDRLKVKLAVLPTNRLAEFAARYPGGQLPATLIRERDEPALGVTVFRVDPIVAIRNQ
jgi:Dolichyl-phosphate-mannose-protein mannosyltransferase